MAGLLTTKKKKPENDMASILPQAKKPFVAKQRDISQESIAAPVPDPTQAIAEAPGYSNPQFSPGSVASKAGDALTSLRKGAGNMVGAVTNYMTAGPRSAGLPSIAEVKPHADARIGLGVNLPDQKAQAPTAIDEFRKENDSLIADAKRLAPATPVQPLAESTADQSGPTRNSMMGFDQENISQNNGVFTPDPSIASPLMPSSPDIPGKQPFAGGMAGTEGKDYSFGSNGNGLQTLLSVANDQGNIKRDERAQKLEADIFESENNVADKQRRTDLLGEKNDLDAQQLALDTPYKQALAENYQANAANTRYETSPEALGIAAEERQLKRDDVKQKNFQDVYTSVLKSLREQNPEMAEEDLQKRAAASANDVVARSEVAIKKANMTPEQKADYEKKKKNRLLMSVVEANNRNRALLDAGQIDAAEYQRRSDQNAEMANKYK